MIEPEATPEDVVTPAAMVVLTPEVADYLLQILNSVHLPVASDNFAEQATVIVAAKAQLAGRLDPA